MSVENLSTAARKLYEQVSAALDRPARRDTSRPPFFTEMSTVSVIILETDDRYQLITLTVHLRLQGLVLQGLGLGPPFRGSAIPGVRHSGGPPSRVSAIW